uniref:hypothetical protein n=1 Tax=Streptosporangium sp. CA-235898 TaxID=3240073 RepID=UPI003F494BBC
MSNGLNLNAARRARAERRKRKAGPFPLYFGEDAFGEDKLIAMVPSEFPMHALAPLTHIDMDMAFLMHVVKEAFRAGSNSADQMVVLGQMIDLLIKTPSLPAQLVTAAQQVAVLVLKEDGYERFMEEEPSLLDVGDLIKGLAAEWGVGRGESTPPEPGSVSGGPSTPTSETSTGSTSPESSTTPETPASSESTTSSPSATSSLTTPE